MNIVVVVIIVVVCEVLSEWKANSVVRTTTENQEKLAKDLLAVVVVASYSVVLGEAFDAVGLSAAAANKTKH